MYVCGRERDIHHTHFFSFFLSKTHLFPPLQLLIDVLVQTAERIQPALAAPRAEHRAHFMTLFRCCRR